jgi:hypothetical protein
VDLEQKLGTTFARFLDTYAAVGGHNHYGWDDYADPRNYKGPTIWSEDDCVFRFGLELEREFPRQVHLELPVARWSFADFDKNFDRQERVDLVVSDFTEFMEDETSHERFMRRRHELFVEGKYFPAGCSRTWRFDHVRKVDAVRLDAERLARHLERGHCLFAAVLVVDDDDLFEDSRNDVAWPNDVRMLVASPRELERRRNATAAVRLR